MWEKPAVSTIRLESGYLNHYNDQSTGYRGSNLGIGKKNSGSALGPIQPPTEWINVALASGAGVASDGQGVRLTAHLRLVPPLKMCGTVPPLPLYALMACIVTTST